MLVSNGLGKKKIELVAAWWGAEMNGTLPLSEESIRQDDPPRGFGEVSRTDGKNRKCRRSFAP